MTIFRLPYANIFPPPHLSDESGLLAVGGDLSIDRLLEAYSLGIFPWYSENDPILWWSPDPRMILIPEEIRISRSLRQTLSRGIFKITFDRAFDRVIRSCASVNTEKHGDTWITEDMINAYIQLHKAGYAHSVEAWHEDSLAGGLYGLSLGSAFFGESMFTLMSNASKAAFATLANTLHKMNFSLIDCQVSTPHLASIGAREVRRDDFLGRLKSSLDSPYITGLWTLGMNEEIRTDNIHL